MRSQHAIARIIDVAVSLAARPQSTAIRHSRITQCRYLALSRLIGLHHEGTISNATCLCLHANARGLWVGVDSICTLYCTRLLLATAAMLAMALAGYACPCVSGGLLSELSSLRRLLADAFASDENPGLAVLL
jgi:hypothetical protein